MASGENFVVTGNLGSLEKSATTSTAQLDSASDAKDGTLTPELKNQVFENELIRDHIFDYVFSCDGSGGIHPTENVLTCRLVDHAWLDYVTYRLQNSGFPAFALDFKYLSKSKKFLNSQPKKYQAQKFLDTWANSGRAGSRVPLFNLQFRSSEMYVAEGGLQALIKCLKRCGRGLYNLSLNFDGLNFFDSDSESDDGMGGSTGFYDDVNTIGQAHFTNLTTLKVFLPMEGYDNSFINFLLARILGGCKRLKFLFLQENFAATKPLSRLLSEENFSAGTEKVPSTLVEINLDLWMKIELLEKLLLQNTLPNLAKLTLSNDKGVANDVLLRIIARYSLQLHSFFLVGSSYRKGEDLPLTQVKFPVMTKLKHMCIKRLHSEVESGMKQCFPVLETLKLEDQTLSMMQKWTQNYPFNFVKDLTVIMFKPFEGTFTQTLSIQLHVAFPHVQKLDINFGSCLLEDGSIRKIFQRMTQLCELFIKLESTGGVMGASAWDAILLGVTPEYARNLAKCSQEEWNSTNLNMLRTPSSSIVNLSSLTTFLLESKQRRGIGDLLISDVSFHFAFLRMPNLHKLTLDHDFGASNKMVKEWKRTGREFNGHLRDD